MVAKDNVNMTYLVKRRWLNSSFRIVSARMAFELDFEIYKCLTLMLMPLPHFKDCVHVQKKVRNHKLNTTKERTSKTNTERQSEGPLRH